MPIVEAAGRNLLQGQDPYTANYSAVTPNLFYYLPLQWLPFVPAVAIGADPRLINAIVVAAIVILTRASLRSERSLVIAYLIFFPVLFSHLFTLAAAGSYMIPYWGLIYLFVYALTTRQDAWAAAILGLLLATRQTSLAIAVASLAGMVWHQPLIRILQLAAIAIGVAALVLGPFIVWHPALLYETFVLLPREELVKVLQNPIASAEIGLMPILRHLGFFGSSFLVQAVIGGIALAVICVRRPENRVTLAVAIGATDFLATVSGGQVFGYYFGTGLLIMSSALIFSPAWGREPGPEEPGFPPRGSEGADFEEKRACR